MGDRNRLRRANGEGSITTRADGALIVRVTIPASGKRLKRIVHRAERADGKRETPSQLRRRAESVIDELRAEADRPDELRQRWTVEKWATERYLPSLTVAPTTREGYEMILATYVLPHVGCVDLTRLTADHVDHLDRILDGGGYSLSTRRHARGALGRVLRHARRKGRVERVVTDDADRLAVDDRDRVRNVLEPDQLRELLRVVKDGAWELPIALLALLGLRKGEMFGIGWDCVDLDTGRLVIRRNLVTVRKQLVLAAPKTASSQRTLDLSPSLVNLFRRHHLRQLEQRLAVGKHWVGPMLDPEGEPVELVHVDEAGRCLTAGALRGALNRAADTAELGHVVPHGLRHAAASVMLAEGMDVPAVAAVLGHATPNVTMSVYAHALRRTKSAATAAISEAVGTW